MCTSGVTAAGSSSVPTRTKRSLGTGAAVNAPDRHFARGAAIDLLRPAAVGRHRDRFEAAGEHGDSVGLDERVEHEGASRLPLAVAAMAAMHEHWRRGEPIAHRPAGASAFQIIGHMLPRIGMHLWPYQRAGPATHCRLGATVAGRAGGVWAR